ncbi:hypothetical protein SLEP1_g44130 [Rubroshorea leprosula]|uniref:FAD dependent oxidoreductase domain-containing protein n=1 Tax=Rubroshorea leprosula TaxID=152421 RepID=A0AAV5LG71_9ROSI|nr:hypothetical protein SLEP1_g44130 [Rubroshorea leprosula]
MKSYAETKQVKKSISSGDVEAVQTSKNMLYGKKAIVLAAGSWSGLLMEDLVRGLDITLNVPVEPRKGNPRGFQLQTGKLL